MSKEISLEFYNSVQSGHTKLANMLYEIVLANFDDRCHLNGRNLNSPQHLLDKESFAQMVRKSIFQELENRDGEELISLSGSYEMYIESLDIIIGASGEARNFETKQEADLWSHLVFNNN